MALSDFWHKLSRKFNELPDPDGLLYAKWKSERDSLFEWSIEATKVVWGGDSVRAQYKVLAARGGKKIDNPHNRDLLSAWLDALNKETASTEFGSSAEILEDGRPARRWGKIHRICEASATFCHKLEYRALEAEHLAKVEQEQKRSVEVIPSLTGIPTRVALRDRYLTLFPKTVILDICWAVAQHYSEWKRWLRGPNVLKDGSAPDRAFRDVLASGKGPREYRKQPRPKGWK